jgi:hypothetical protein
MGSRASGTLSVPFSAGTPWAFKRWSTSSETRVPSCNGDAAEQTFFHGISGDFMEI